MVVFREEGAVEVFPGISIAIFFLLFLFLFGILLFWRITGGSHAASCFHSAPNLLLLVYCFADILAWLLAFICIRYGGAFFWRRGASRCLVVMGFCLESSDGEALALA